MEIKIGGRTIPMTMTSYEMLTIQDEIGCTVGQLRDNVFGVEQNLETGEYSFSVATDREKLKKFGTLLKILGNAGLEEAGQEPDLTDKWILRHIKPIMLMAYVVAATAVINEAMKMESEANSDGPVDEVLAEENRKKGPGSSPTGESAPADSSPGSAETRSTE